MIRTSLVIFFLFLSSVCLAQDSLKIEQIKFFRFGMQNDLFQIKNQSDKFFSAGFFYELRHPVFKFGLTEKILLSQKDVPLEEFSLRIDHLGFTPSDITSSEIDTTDRPYAGLLYGNLIRSSTDYRKGRRLTSTLRIGIMGPAAGMELVQSTIHDLTGSTPPEGWENQVGNALILDYNVRIVQKLPIALKFFEVHGAAEAEIGSIFNSMSAGLEFRLGRYNDLFINTRGLYGPNQDLSKINRTRFTQGITDRKFQFYVFANPTLRWMIYDGTISGGLIPFEESPHTLDNSDLEHFINTLQFGVVIQYSRVGFRYQKSIRSERFFEGDIFSFGQFDLVYIW